MPNDIKQIIFVNMNMKLYTGAHLNLLTFRKVVRQQIWGEVLF